MKTEGGRVAGAFASMGFNSRYGRKLQNEMGICIFLAYNILLGFIFSVGTNITAVHELQKLEDAKPKKFLSFRRKQEYHSEDFEYCLDSDDPNKLEEGQHRCVNQRGLGPISGSRRGGKGDLVVGGGLDAVVTSHLRRSYGHGNENATKFTLFGEPRARIDEYEIWEVCA